MEIDGLRIHLKGAPPVQSSVVRAEALNPKSQLFEHQANFQFLTLDDFCLVPMIDTIQPVSDFSAH